MSSTALVVVLVVAAAVPMLRGLALRLPLPGPLLELLAGLALGPTGFGWVHVDGLISAVAVLGMAFLLFLAGFEVDVRGLTGADGKVAGRGLLASVVLAALAAAVLLAIGWPLKAALLVASALMATSVGLVGPLLKDAGLLGRPLGRLTLAGAALGEVTAVLLISVGFSVSHGPIAALAVLAVVIVVGGAAAWAVSAASRQARIAMAVLAQSEGGGQARIRLTVLAVTALALLASKLGLEAVLGAFLAGGLARLIDPDPEATHPAYPIKLDAIGFGFLVPVFFVTSGLKLDLRAVLTDSRCRGARSPRPRAAPAGARVARPGLPTTARRAGDTGERSLAGDLPAVLAHRRRNRPVNGRTHPQPRRRARCGRSVFRNLSAAPRACPRRYGSQVEIRGSAGSGHAADIPVVSESPDALVVDRLRERDEETFHTLVRAWSPMMLRLASGYVTSTATAEEVVQETWLAVVRGVDKFEGRSTLRTWVLRICVNQAKRHGMRESRIQPAGMPTEQFAGTVDAGRFRPAGDRWPGHWTDAGAPEAWGPEAQVLTGEVRHLLLGALRSLPQRQARVVALRDIHGLDGAAVAELIGTSEGNVRVLLHRGRAALRREVELSFTGAGGGR